MGALQLRRLFFARLPATNLNREMRLAWLALLVGVLGALALAGITLLLFPAYRGDVLAVLPWVPLAACPLFYLLGRGAGFRRRR